MLCPCGSNLSFKACCQPFITKGTFQNRVSTPEQLMRSRFSAYAIKDGQYIYDTYGEKQRLNLNVNELQSWADECIWLALIIHNADGNTVEFSAYYVVNNTLCELREISNFVLEPDPIREAEQGQKQAQKQWRYIDGKITKNDEIANIKRNEICPCNDFSTAWSTKKGKKFKHCCGK